MTIFVQPRTATSIGQWARSRAATIVAFLVILMTMLGPLMSFKLDSYTGDGSPARQIIYLAAFVLMVGAARPLTRSRKLFALPLTMLLALSWCWLSLSWAIEPAIAFRRLALTTMIIWTIFLAVRELGYEAITRALRLSFAFVLGVNWIAVLLFPEFGIHKVSEALDPGIVGSWRGIMLQKNFAGAACALTIISFLIDCRSIGSRTRVAVLTGAAIFLVMTGSKTSTGILIGALLFGWLFIRYNPAYRMLLIPPLLVIASGVILLLAIYQHNLIAPLYDPGAFTGRTQIWPPMLAFARDHPLFGAGFGSFWNIRQEEGPIFLYAKGWVTNLGMGHNGYLDLVVTIGVPGLILVIVAALLAPIARLVASRQIQRARGGLLIAIIVFALGHNFTESSLFDRDAIVQVFLIFAVAMSYYLTRDDSPRWAPLARRQPAIAPFPASKPIAVGERLQPLS